VRRVEKPWGYEIIWAETAAYVGKILFIRKGQKLSLQYHNVKEETIYVHSGSMIFTTEEGGGLAGVEMRAGDSRHIPPLMKHRMEAIEDCTVFEVSTPHLDDVVRLEDAYGRVR
jgi:quercetin dioxygenase-like cupin family protein